MKTLLSEQEYVASTAQLKHFQQEVTWTGQGINCEHFSWKHMLLTVHFAGQLLNETDSEIKMFKFKSYIDIRIGCQNTCVTCQGSFRKLAKGNNSKHIEARVMDLVHDS